MPLISDPLHVRSADVPQPSRHSTLGQTLAFIQRAALHPTRMGPDRHWNGRKHLFKPRAYWLCEPQKQPYSTWLSLQFDWSWLRRKSLVGIWTGKQLKFLFILLTSNSFPGFYTYFYQNLQISNKSPVIPPGKAVWQPKFCSPQWKQEVPTVVGMLSLRCIFQCIEIFRHGMNTNKVIEKIKT